MDEEEKSFDASKTELPDGWRFTLPKGRRCVLCLHTKEVKMFLLPVAFGCRTLEKTWCITRDIPRQSGELPKYLCS